MDDTDTDNATLRSDTGPASSFSAKVLSEVSKTSRPRAWLEAHSPLVDRAVVLEAVTIAGDVLQYASEELRGDKEVVIAAVQKEVVRSIRNHVALQYASNELRGDKEVVMAAVSQDHALKFASDELRGDKDVLMAAVSHHGVTLMYGPGICDDKEIVMRAVETWGLAVEFASDELRGDKEVGLAAVSSNPLALDFLSKELHSDMSFVTRVMRCETVAHLKYRGIDKYFPPLARNLRELFWEVLQATNYWSSSDSVAPGTFEGHWQSLLAETQWCVSLAIPHASAHVLEFSTIEEEYSLLQRMREYDPMISVLLDCPHTFWFAQAKSYIIWVDDCKSM